MNSTELKAMAAVAWAAELRDGMVVGLGSGSTAKLVVDAIGVRVKGGLKIIGIPTSEATAEQAAGLGIPLSTLGEYPRVDVTIDGADEVELGTLNLIKGGGGNQLREKIVAAASSRFIVTIDESKLVDHLGDQRKVPVEVAQFGWQSTARSLTKLSGVPELRTTADGKAFVTDGGNYILDCAFGRIASAEGLQRELDSVVGVVEHGLFIGMAALIVIGAPAGVRRMERIA
ncbi:MAG: ribose-5-phosphate isomerase RpiA [Acidobacteriota bacterium]|nr:ribose-5-phosphate isomerase RpiA [Acidobacteriota bacterium]